MIVSHCSESRDECAVKAREDCQMRMMSSKSRKSVGIGNLVPPAQWNKVECGAVDKDDVDQDTLARQRECRGGVEQ